MMPRVVHVTQSLNWWREITIWATFSVTAKIGPHILEGKPHSGWPYGHPWENNAYIRKRNLWSQFFIPRRQLIPTQRKPSKGILGWGDGWVVAIACVFPNMNRIQDFWANLSLWLIKRRPQLTLQNDSRIAPREEREAFPGISWDP